MRKNASLALAALAATAGLFFASYSTHDFVQHLDRDVHELNCSFVPGLIASDASGESGCQVTLMSPYSSILRESVWGGIPISLPAMAVFGFLVAFALFLMIGGHQDDKRATGFYLAAWGVPVIASAVMGYIAFSTLDAACKLCIGIYAASGVGLIASIVAFVLARGEGAPAAAAPRRPVRAEGGESFPEDEPAPAPARASLGWGVLAGAFAIGVLFVVIPVAAYAAAAPDFSSYVGQCGTLANPADPHHVLLPIGPQSRSVPVIEVIDPLCPSCRGFERRFDSSSVNERTNRKVLLFPLDDECNWMISDAIHPGACAISEAVLCAEGDAEEVIDWAFDNQQQITAAARRNPDAARNMARERFPSLADCIGSPNVEARLNASLRWAVQNELPVLTPQVYVGSSRLCDADTDLGMDFALTRLVDRYRPGSEPIAPEPTETVSLTAPARPPVAQPAAQPGVQPAAQPGAQPAPQPAAQPAQPAVQPAQPAAQPAQPAQPAAQPAQPAPTPTPEPAPAAEPAPSPEVTP